MSNDVIERVARAICASDEQNGGASWDYYPDRSKGFYRDSARAALAALRPGDELPGGLVVVPKEATMRQLAAGQSAWLADPERKSSTLYRAMIAAVKEG